MTTEIHDTHTCPCEMCVWVRETAANKPKSPLETYYGHPRLDTGQDKFLVPEAKNVSSRLLAQNSPISAPTFTEEWESAPRWATRTTEQIAAEYWFLRGGHAKEVELTGVINEDLREIRRVAGERLEQ